MNSKEIFVLEEARYDLEEGKKFYESIEKRIGKYFWDSLLSNIKSLLIYSGLHIKEFRLHRMLAKRFPYFIYYFVKNDESYVVAVLPMRRDPKWIASKISERESIK